MNVGCYYCQVKNQYGVVNSATATVTVTSQTAKHPSRNYDSVDRAFSAFVDKIFEVLNKEDFRIVRRKCFENVNVRGGIKLSADVENKICTTENLYDLFDILCNCKPYWNWMNIRMLDKMAGNSSAAKQLIQQYRDNLYSRKVKDVMLEISRLDIPIDKYTEVKEKLDIKFGDLTIGDIVDRWDEIEFKLNAEGTMLLKSITDGCVEICWLLPNDYVDHAICLATNSQPDKHDDQSATQVLFPEVLYLKIGDVVIKDDITSKFHVVQDKCM